MTQIKDNDNGMNYIQKAIIDSPCMKGIQKENLPNFQFFQIKRGLSKTHDGKVMFTLQFVDISSKIFYDDVKAQEEFTSLINSTISHEMRNPLNSIVSETKVQEENIRELKLYI